MSGQAYRISLGLEMPESPVNEQLGMFMIKMSCYTTNGTVVQSVARSVSACNSRKIHCCLCCFGC